MSTQAPVHPSDEPERPPAPVEHPSLPPKQYKRPVTTTIMILGASGSGKSSLVNMVSGETFPVASEGAGACTTHFNTTRPFTISERPFRLIDSPGFNAASPNDFEIMRKLVYYLARARDKWNTRLAGVLYLHSERSTLETHRLKNITKALRHLFGEPWLPYFAIAITGNEAVANSDLISQSKDSGSPFHPLCSGGAKVITLPLGAQQIREALLCFDPSTPPQPRFYYRIRFVPPSRIEGVERLIEEVMRFYRAEPSENAGSSHKIALEESEANRQQLQIALNQNEAALKSVQSQLERTELEYAALYSELQLNDNTEERKIVQSLGDLNHAINTFGRSVAAYMVDTYKEDRFGPGDATTLGASNLDGLQAQFGHQMGTSSLVTSFQGAGLPLEDFIDLALRSFVYQKLFHNVFIPFHPLLAGSTESSFMLSLYEKVRRQAPPNVAARWRASAFIALSDGIKVNQPRIDSQVESLVSEDIQPLLNHLFGEENSITLIDTQLGQLRDIITFAWEWNYLLKGEVVALGDFRPLYCERGVPFDPETMVGFETSERRQDDVAICTVKLGLTLSYPRGSGKDSGPSVVRQATVVTPAIYA